LAQALGCLACHSVESSGQFGPTWKGLLGRKRELVGGFAVTADDAYLRESILEPAAKIVLGYETSMPSYAGSLQPAEVESLVLFIKSLR